MEHVRTCSRGVRRRATREHNHGRPKPIVLTTTWLPMARSPALLSVVVSILCSEIYRQEEIRSG